MTAFTSLLPAVGSGLVWGPAAIYLFATGDILRGVILVAVGVGVIGMADNILRPLLLSGRTTMHGLLVFISLLGGHGRVRVHRPRDRPRRHRRARHAARRGAGRSRRRRAGLSARAPGTPPTRSRWPARCMMDESVRVAFLLAVVSIARSGPPSRGRAAGAGSARRGPVHGAERGRPHDRRRGRLPATRRCCGSTKWPRCSS